MLSLLLVRKQNDFCNRNLKPVAYYLLQVVFVWYGYERSGLWWKDSTSPGCCWGSSRISQVINHESLSYFFSTFCNVAFTVCSWLLHLKKLICSTAQYVFLMHLFMLVFRYLVEVCGVNTGKNLKKLHWKIIFVQIFIYRLQGSLGPYTSCWCWTISQVK
jgi:hypothetical protein